MKTIDYPESARSIEIDTELKYTPLHEVRLLVWLASMVPGDILEIGCSHGWTTRALALHFPHRLVHAVDWPDNPKLWSKQAGEKPKKVAELAADLPNVRTHNCDSRKMNYPEGVGFIFIDGEHTAASVKADSGRAFLYARSHDVIIAWHDYTTLFIPDVVDYLDALSENGCPLLHIKGTMVAFANFAWRPPPEPAIAIPPAEA